MSHPPSFLLELSGSYYDRLEWIDVVAKNVSDGGSIFKEGLIPSYNLLKKPVVRYALSPRIYDFALMVFIIFS